VADFPSFDDLFRQARDEAMIRNGKLTRDAVERQGTDANILFAGAAAAADEVISQLIQVEAGLFLDSAVGAALDRLVFDRYGLTRKPAAAALGQVNFTTTTPTGGPFTIPSGTMLSTSNGLQYITTVDSLFPAASVGPIIVPVRSVLAGLDQQADDNTITSIVSQIVGQPTDLAVNNPLATAGADDAESDDSLRARARQFFVTARRGTLAAIEQGALAVPGVRTAVAFEALDGNGNPARLVELVITDAYTDSLAALNPTPASYAAQAQILAQQVFAGLSDVRAAGINVQVTVAQVVMLPITLNLAFNAGADVATATQQARAAAVNYTNGLPAGTTWDPLALSTALKSVSGLHITGNEVFSPNGPVVPLTLQVIRTTLALVTAPVLA
jgi:uncharacterized phage protein gp47/JayE